MFFKTQTKLQLIGYKKGPTNVDYSAYFTTICVSVIYINVSFAQVITLNSWPSNAVGVPEVQKVSVSSSCTGQSCGSTFFSLGYEDAVTGNVFYTNSFGN